MAGGQISECLSRASAQSPTSAQASSSTRAAGSPPAAGREVVRPAELGGLARRVAFRLTSNAGDVSLSRRIDLPAHAAASEVPGSPLAVFNKALRHANVWSDLAEGEREREALGWEHKQLSLDKEVQYALAAMESIQKALQTLPTLRQQRQFGPDYDANTVEGELLVLQAKAAETGLCARHATLNEEIDRRRAQEGKAEPSQVARAGSGQDGSSADPAEEHGQARRPSSSARKSVGFGASEDTGKLSEWLGEFTRFRTTLDDVTRRAKAPETSRIARAMFSAQQSSVVYNQLRCCTGVQGIRGVLAAVSANRLSALAQQRALPEVATRSKELSEAWKRQNEAMEAAVDALVRHGAKTDPADDLTPREVARHQALLVEYAEGIDRVGLSLCMDATTHVEMDGADGVWGSMMEVAHAIAAYKAALLDLRETAGRVRIEPGKMHEPQTPAPSHSRPPPAARPAQPSGDAGRKPGKPPVEPSAPAPEPAPAPVDRRTRAQKDADTLLRKCPVDRKTAVQFGGDIVSIARTLGKDTSLVERALNDPKRDAAMAADFVRGTARGWFGEEARVRGARSSLPARDDRIAQLNDRLAALALIERHVDVREADALKCDAHPRSVHLDRLRKGNEIAHVRPPRRLPRATGNDVLGTLFEMRIELKPLSNRQPVAPWFVHLHTEKPVTAQALSRMEFRDFTAVHLKTDKEKNLGPRWEAVMRALGHTDAKVHRAAIGSELLSELFESAQRQSHRGSRRMQQGN